MNTIRVAIIVDPFGAMDRDGSEEIDDHKQHLTKLFPQHTLVFSTPGCVLETLDADLVIFDFGGMSLGNSLLQDNSRRLVRWMQDHPSSLVFVASTFSYSHGLEPELRDLGIDSEYDPWETDVPRKMIPPLPNLLVGHCSQVFGYGTHISNRIKDWFNVLSPSRKRAHPGGDGSTSHQVLSTEHAVPAADAPIQRKTDLRRGRGDGTRQRVAQKPRASNDRTGHRKASRSSRDRSKRR